MYFIFVFINLTFNAFAEYKSNPEFHQVFQFASSANAERYFEAINDLFKSGYVFIFVLCICLVCSIKIRAMLKNVSINRSSFRVYNNCYGHGT